MILVQVARNPAGFYAERLHDSMKVRRLLNKSQEELIINIL